MSYEPINIIPYKPSCEADIREIEIRLAQGKFVKLELLRDSYISRAKVFPSHASYLGYSEQGQLVGTVIGTKVPIKINGRQFKAGFGLDLQVVKEWKDKGAGKQLSGFVTSNFFSHHKLTRNFVTLKADQVPVSNTWQHLIKGYSCTDFTYLVIPTASHVKQLNRFDRGISFSTELLDKKGNFGEFVSCFNNGLSAWHNHKFYKVKVQSIHPVAGFVTRIVSLLRNKSYPSAGDEINTATLFNLNGKNIVHLNDALQQLDQKGVNYLNVVCKKNDPVYTRLKQYSIYTYHHYILADFEINDMDQIVIDVRCL